MCSRCVQSYESFLVIGEGIPEGDTVYVARRNKRDFADVVLWNACTGRGYDITDDDMPLQSIGMVASEENLWGNIQPNDKPSSMSFDFDNKTQWRPFFTPRFPRKQLASVQATKLKFRKNDPKYAENLRMDIHETLKVEFRSWRLRRRLTRIHNPISKQLQTALESLEQQRLEGVAGASNEEHLRGLERVTATYEIHGFPLHFAYTDVDSIVQVSAMQ